MERFERLRRWVAPWSAAQAILRRRGAHGGRPDNVGRLGTAFRGHLREVVQLAWPIAAAMLGDTAMGLVDTRLVGSLGAYALGGVGTAVVLMYLNYSVVFGLMRGVKVR